MKLLMLAFLVGLAALFVWASADLPDRADPNAPANQHLSPELTEMTESEVVIPNLVSAILADFRSYDTLGETFVIFTAGLAIVLVLQRSRRVRDEESGDE